MAGISSFKNKNYSKQTLLKRSVGMAIAENDKHIDAKAYERFFTPVYGLKTKGDKKCQTTKS